jgi:hypothetical protein
MGGGVQIAVAHDTATPAVHTAMLLTVEFFCNMTSCLLVNCFLLFWGLLDTEDEGSTLIRNVGKYLLVFAACRLFLRAFLPLRNV